MNTETQVVNYEIRTVRLDDIVRDDRVRVRETEDPDAVDSYRQSYEDGETLPRPVVFEVDGKLILTAGGHRIPAMKRAGLDAAEIEVRQGTIFDAVLHAAGDNRRHGVRMSNVDKRAAVRAILLQSEGRTMSDRKIGQHIGVDHKTVGDVRADLESTGEIPQSDNRTGADGREIRVAEIGKKPAPDAVDGINPEDLTTTPENIEDADSGDEANQEPGEAQPTPPRKQKAKYPVTDRVEMALGNVVVLFTKLENDYGTFEDAIRSKGWNKRRAKYVCELLEACSRDCVRRSKVIRQEQIINRPKIDAPKGFDADSEVLKMFHDIRKMFKRWPDGTLAFVYLVLEKLQACPDWSWFLAKEAEPTTPEDA